MHERWLYNFIDVFIECGIRLTKIILIKKRKQWNTCRHVEYTNSSCTLPFDLKGSILIGRFKPRLQYQVYFRSKKIWIDSENCLQQAN
jgi:DNA modification methylase